MLQQMNVNESCLMIGKYIPNLTAYYVLLCYISLYCQMVGKVFS